jgi:hypothetical protein
MSARTSGSRLTGIRPDLSAVVRMTKEEGSGKLSPGFSLGWDFNPMVRPHKVLLLSAHGEKHPPCRVGAAERAQELSNPYHSSALAGLSRGGWNSPLMSRYAICDLSHPPADARPDISPAELRMLDLTRRPDWIL